MLSEKHVLEILAHCVKSAGEEGSFRVPVMFAESHRKIPEDEVYSTLRYLREKGYVKLSSSLLYPKEEGTSEYSIDVLTLGYDFLLETDRKKGDFRKNWRWNIWAAIITALISSLLGALLARVSQLIWP